MLDGARPLVVGFTLNSAVLSSEASALLFSLVGRVADHEFLVLQGLACDLGGPVAAARVAHLRGQVVKSELERRGHPAERILVVPPVVLLGAPREPLRRTDIYGPLSRTMALQLARALTDQARELSGASTAGAQQAVLRRRPRPGHPRGRGGALLGVLALAVVLLALLAAGAVKRGLHRQRLLKASRFAPGEKEALEAEVSRQLLQSSGHNVAPGHVRGGPGAGHPAQKLLEHHQGKSTMASKKKAEKSPKGPSIRGALDREFAGMTLGELAGAPVSALQGLTPRHARLLEEAFGIRTVEDLSRLKYVEIARAIVVLAEFDP